jgi:outer membrane protein OmpU
MKKILLATTILSMSAGFAAADVAVSGDARMGIVSSDGNSTFSSRVRFSFSGSGTTDGGLAFGGSARADNASGASGGTAGSVFISGAFGKISMGDVSSGDNAAVGQLSSVGFQGLGSGNSISYAADGGLTGTDNDGDLAGTGGAKVLYTYSAGALTVSASTGQLSNSDAGVHQAYGLGVSYAAGSMTLAAGYGSNSIEVIDGVYDGVTGTITDVTAAVTYAMGATTVKAIYQNKSANVSYEDADVDLGSAVSMGVSVDHTIDAMTLTAYTISTNITSDLGGIDATVSRMGVGVAYSLGGGASVKAGWAQLDALDGDSTSAMDVGVNFSF